MYYLFDLFDLFFRYCEYVYSGSVIMFFHFFPLVVFLILVSFSGFSFQLVLTDLLFVLLNLVSQFVFAVFLSFVLVMIGYDDDNTITVDSVCLAMLHLLFCFFISFLFAALIVQSLSFFNFVVLNYIPELIGVSSIFALLGVFVIDDGQYLLPTINENYSKTVSYLSKFFYGCDLEIVPGNQDNQDGCENHVYTPR